MSADDRLPTELWVASVLRGAAAKTIPVYVLHRGAAASGTVVVKAVLGGGQCRLFNQSRDMEGKIVWLSPLEEKIVTEARADDYISRARSRDPDLWVIEVEDARGRNPFLL